MVNLAIPITSKPGHMLNFFLVDHGSIIIQNIAMIGVLGLTALAARRLPNHAPERG